jgi:putative tryptophan/tyrosine transport system substrate-binding protein
MPCGIAPTIQLLKCATGKLLRHIPFDDFGGVAGARAQRSEIPVIGFLSGALEADYTPFVAAFRQGLSDSGFIEGRNVAIEYRWAEGRYDRLPSLADQLVQRQVAVLVASGGDNPAYIAKTATSTIPIVFIVGIDPSKVGLVASLNRPGGNATGVSLLSEEVVSKQVDLLRSLLPSLTAIGVLVDPDNPNAETQIREAEAAANGIRIAAAKAHAEQELDAAFAWLATEKVDALVVGATALFLSQRIRIVDLASHHALPTIYFDRSMAAAGGLISYGTNILFIYRQLGIYTGSILKGAKPGDLPVLLPTKFELVINLKTARQLHINVPPMLLALTDDVIE